MFGQSVWEQSKIKVLLFKWRSRVLRTNILNVLKTSIQKARVHLLRSIRVGNADNPNNTSMWDLPRYVEEVEQVA